MEKSIWETFLKTPKKDLTDEDWLKMRQHARFWGTCAVGCRLDLPTCDTSILPDVLDQKKVNNWIRDRLTNKAETLGNAFWHAIKDENLAKAKRIFNEIHGMRKIFKTAI